MGWSVATAAAWLTAAALGAAPALAGDGFVDPLDVPAQPSALAPQAPLAAVAPAGTRLVAAGLRGHVLWSDDGGRRWTQAAVPVSTDLTAVRFASAERGWAVGHDGVILSTADGGRTWSRQLDRRTLGPLLATREAAPAAPGAEPSFLDVWLDDERNGVAVGAFGLVVRTGDGGRSWTPWDGGIDNPRGLHLYAVRRVGATLFVAGEQGLVLRLDPARRRLVALRVPSAGTFFGLLGDGRTVVAFGLAGHAVRSGDGGATWRQAATGVGESLTGGASLPDGRLLLVTEAGQVLESKDDGRSFAPVAAVRGEPTAGIAPAGPGALVLVGPGGVRRVDFR